jgi:hypothetical protein
VSLRGVAGSGPSSPQRRPPPSSRALPSSRVRERRPCRARMRGSEPLATTDRSGGGSDGDPADVRLGVRG